jgi:hypothetical protein
MLLKNTFSFDHAYLTNEGGQFDFRPHLFTDQPREGAKSFAQATTLEGFITAKTCEEAHIRCTKYIRRTLIHTYTYYALIEPWKLQEAAFIPIVFMGLMHNPTACAGKTAHKFSASAIEIRKAKNAAALDRGTNR